MWGVSLTHPMLALILSGEFLLHIPCLLYLSVGSFSYTSHAGFFICLIWGVSLTHPRLASFLSGEFLLHIPCWLLFFFYLGSFSYTSRAAFILIWEGSPTHPVQASFLSSKFLLHISCLLYSSVGSFSYTSHVGFFVCVNLGSFSYTSRDSFIFIWGVSLTHPVVVFCCCFLSGKFLLHIPCWLYFLSREFLLYFPACYFHFYAGSFSYTSRTGFIFMHGVFLSYPLLASFLSQEILLHILCWLHFYVWSFSYTSHAAFFSFLFLLGSFSYTSRASFIYIWGFSLTHPVLALFISGDFLLHIPCLLYFSLGSGDGEVLLNVLRCQLIY